MSSMSPNQQCRSIAYLPTGDGIACGLNDGSVIIVNADTLETVHGIHDRKEWIQVRSEPQIVMYHFKIADSQVLKFDPSGDFLAVGSHEGFIDIYVTADVMNNPNPPTRSATCKVYTSPILSY